MSLLELKDITAGYDKNVILKNLNLNAEKGELVSLLGPSGCGKTTTLRLIAGFSEPMSGQFLFDGKDYTNIPLHKRNFGFVFQSYALFPHMNIYDNVAFGLRQRKMPESQIKTEVMDMLHTVDLDGFEGRLPKEMSGGQRQRVALARAMVIKPDLMLFDEPLSNLDAKLRVQMRVEIRKLQQKLGFTAIYVTHDQEECFAISDKVAIMNHGIIEQMDTPAEIYNHPKTEFISRFVGFENFMDLTRVGTGAFKTDNGTEIGVTEDNLSGDRLKACIRPEDIVICGDEGAANAIRGQISVQTFLGKRTQYNVSTSIGELIVSSADENVFSVGDNITLSLTPNKIVLIPSI